VEVVGEGGVAGDGVVEVDETDASPREAVGEFDVLQAVSADRLVQEAGGQGGLAADGELPGPDVAEIRAPALDQPAAPAFLLSLQEGVERVAGLEAFLDDPADGGDVRIGAVSREVPGDEARIGLHVVVEDQDDPGPGGADSGVPGGAAA